MRIFVDSYLRLAESRRAIACLMRKMDCLVHITVYLMRMTVSLMLTKVFFWRRELLWNLIVWEAGR